MIIYALYAIGCMSALVVINYLIGGLFNDM